MKRREEIKSNHELAETLAKCAEDLGATIHAHQKNINTVLDWAKNLAVDDSEPFLTTARNMGTTAGDLWLLARELRAAERYLAGRVEKSTAANAEALLDQIEVEARQCPYCFRAGEYTGAMTDGMPTFQCVGCSTTWEISPDDGPDTYAPGVARPVLSPMADGNADEDAIAAVAAKGGAMITTTGRVKKKGGVVTLSGPTEITNFREAKDDENTGNPPPRDRDGETYERSKDFSRLNKQEQKVFDVMKDGKYRSLSEISAATDAPEASVSARLRDFRKIGGVVDRFRVGNGPRSGLYLYALTSYNFG